MCLSQELELPALIALAYPTNDITLIGSSEKLSYTIEGTAGKDLRLPTI